jgi:hypothetical protein
MLIALFMCFSLRVQGQSLSVYANDFLDSTAKSPQTIWEPAATSAFSHFVYPKPDGFGTGTDGYMYQFGVSLADNVNAKFMRTFVFAAASGHRDKYCPLQTGGFWKGMGSAIVRTLFIRPPNTPKIFNWSGIPASFVSAGLSNVYQPGPQRTWSATFGRGGFNVGGYVGGNVWNQLLEEWKLNRRHKVYVVLKNR